MKILLRLAKKAPAHASNYFGHCDIERTENIENGALELSQGTNVKAATDCVHVLMRKCSHEGVVGSSCRGVVGFSLRCMRVTLVEFFSKGIACTHVELLRSMSVLLDLFIQFE